MDLQSNFNLFTYRNPETFRKETVKGRYNMSLDSLKTNNKDLDSIFKKVDLNKDGILQANELNTLNKLTSYADTLVKETANNRILEEKEIKLLKKQLDKGQIDPNNFSKETQSPMNKPWSEGLNRNIKTLEISRASEEYINNFGTIREELKQIGELEGFSVKEIYNGKAPWMEDSKIYRADKKVYVNYYNYADLNNNESVIRDFENARKAADGVYPGRHGAVARDGSNFAAGNSTNSKVKHIGTSYLEGGNVLQTLKSDGSAGAVIGEMSIATTMSALGMENTPENIQKTKEIIAQDLGIDKNNLTVIPQYEFHIDMCYRPLGDGQFAVPDYDSGIKYLEDRLNSKDAKLDKESPANASKTLRQDYTEMLAWMKEQRDSTKSVRDKVEAQLQKDGYTLVKIPCFGNETNFMNAIGGTSNKDGKTFLITNRSDYPELNSLIENTYTQNGVDRVYFVSTKGALDKRGGIDCLTNAY